MVEVARIHEGRHEHRDAVKKMPGYAKARHAVSWEMDQLVHEYAGAVKRKPGDDEPEKAEPGHRRLRQIDQGSGITHSQRQQEVEPVDRRPRLEQVVDDALGLLDRERGGPPLAL